jgi:hypothetical protein
MAPMPEKLAVTVSYLISCRILRIKETLARGR